MKTALLFDLDGTLSNPKVGITGSIRHALTRMGHAAPSADALEWCIGPPLIESFAVLLDSDDPALAQQALDHYREHYVEIGLFENQLYDGIREILAEFSGQGQRLYVATAKPETFARRVITYFELDEFFSGIYGPTLEGLRNDKRDLLGYLVAKTNLVPASAVMIGDRKHDIQAALAHGITSIGVCYGFGSPAELSAAGCDYLVDNVTDLHQLLRRLCPREIPERNRSDLQE